MTIEEKAEAYAKVREKIALRFGSNVAEEIFSEFEESEDERIRKWCISHFKECINVIKDNDEYKEYLSNKVIAWLEKQGELQEGCVRKTVAEVKEELYSGQVWSEEDEEELGIAIKYLQREGQWDSATWLKSLKERCIWKPTKEHVKAVRLARSFVTDDFGEHPTLSETLIDLEEQLKKLREE